MSKKIFVSYTTRDKYVTNSLLFAIESLLRPMGKCYIDILHNDSSNKQERVEQELKTSNLVLLVKSESAYSSIWVARELLLAKYHNIRVVDVQISSADSEQSIIQAVSCVIAESTDLACR